MKRRGMKTRSRRGRLAVRKTRSRRSRRSWHTPRKSKRQQRGGSFLDDTRKIPVGSAITVNTLPGDPEEPIAPYVDIKKEGEEEGATAPEEVA
jgi:hypothetical protein